MKILGGKYQRQAISISKKTLARPTTNFAKQGLFNTITSSYSIENAEVLDLFAGTGSIGFEFLSRGASQCTFVDSDNNNVFNLKNNLKSFEQDMTSSVVRKDVFTFLKSVKATFDFIFADPPFHFKNHSEIIDEVCTRQLLKEDGLLIIEHKTLFKIGYRINPCKVKKYGNCSFSFYNQEDLY